MDRIRKGTTRLPAASLQEVVVALVVIFTVFGISMALYTNVLRSTANLQKVKAMAELERIAAETKNTYAFTDAALPAGNFIVQRTITASPLAQELLHLHLEVQDAHQKLLATYDELLLPEK